MNLNDYFIPVSLEKPADEKLADPYLFCKNIYINTPDTPIKDLKNYNVALIGVPEGKLSLNEDCANGPDEIRNSLYQLNRLGGKIKIIDLGNLKISGNPNDTIFGLRDVLEVLLKNNITPVILGGSKNLSYALYLAYMQIKNNLQVVAFEPSFDMGKTMDDNSAYFLEKILAEKENGLFNYSLLGFQSCFIDKEELDKINNLRFQSIRIGLIRANFNNIEPVVRDADIISFSLNAIKQSDAPAHHKPSPNGFYAEEACQVARYAGLSNKNAIFGLFDLFPSLDINHQSAHLFAQMIWYFLEAFVQRKNENYEEQPKEFRKYIVSAEESGQDLVFYKNIRSHRWWMEVPYIKKNKEKFVLVACSEEDYNMACQHEIPERWLHTFQKIN